MALLLCDELLQSLGRATSFHAWPLSAVSFCLWQPCWGSMLPFSLYAAIITGISHTIGAADMEPTTHRQPCCAKTSCAALVPAKGKITRI